MKVWDERDLDIGRFDLYLNGKEAVLVRDVGDHYRARAYLRGAREEFYVEKKPLDEVKKDIEGWYADKLRGYIVSLENALVSSKKMLSALESPVKQSLVFEDVLADACVRADAESVDKGDKLVEFEKE